MGKIKIGLIVLGSIALIGLVVAGVVMAKNSPDKRKAEFVQDEIIVKFKGDVKPFRVIKVPKGKVFEEVEKYKKREEVIYAEPNYIAYTQMVPNDPYYGYQWHLDNPVYGGIQMEEAWDISRGAGVTVAVVDTGIRVGTDLAKTCFVSGYDFVNNDDDPVDDNGHGTHVAGTVGQSTNNSLGVAGVAFESCLMPVKVLSAAGSGTYQQVADGIYYAVDNGVKVINLSLGGASPSLTLEEAVAYAYQKGVTVVAACGNDNVSSCLYPAAYDDYVIAVGATQYDETKAPYSNYGPSLDLVAPGGNTSLDQNNDGYGDGVLQQTFRIVGRRISWGYYFFQGTSMATPHVAGVAALLIAKGNATTPDDIRTALQTTAEDKGATGRDDIYGYGLVDAYAALGWTATPNTPPTAYDVSATTDEDVAVEITLSGSDSEQCELNFSIINPPANGSLSAITNQVCVSGTPNKDYALVTYTPDANYNGSDSFTYQVNDGRADSNIATVLVTINPVNNAPIANDQKVTTTVNTPVNITLTGSDVESCELTFSIINPPANGSLSAITDQVCVSGSPNTDSALVTYTPNTDYTGSDSFTFKVNDGTIDSDIATVSITVNPAVTEVLCWAGTNQYLYRNKDQAAKFCKCASGIYGYNSYTSRLAKVTVYQYVDTGDNENWEVTSRSSKLPVYQVTCTDSQTYPTNRDYSYPK